MTFLPAFSRRRLLGAALACGAGPAWSQPAAELPARPLRIVSTSAPGGNIDVLTRIVANELALRLKQPVIVDNKPGASGIPGTLELLRAPADGSTLLVTLMSTMVANRVLYPKLPYDPLRDFAPITQIAYGNVILLAPANAPYRDLKGLADYARRQPKPMTYGSAGVGTSLHLYGMKLATEHHLPLSHVPYKGGGAPIQDLANGVLDLTFGSISDARPYIERGLVRPLAVIGSRRFDSLPELPTFGEQGFAGFELPVWCAAYYPAKTPPAIVERMSREFAAVLHDPAVRARLLAIGHQAIGNTPREFAANYAADFPKWEALIQASGARAE
jgi:tripartite-type tricarboxylate transporter receptor subunit TctC